MTTTTAVDAATAPTIHGTTRTFWALARIESGRLARHPLLLAGTAYGAVGTVLAD